MRTIYFDCINGASGDMILGALLDAGVPHDRVVASIDTLGLPIASIDVQPVTKGSIRATRAEVASEQEPPSRTYRDIRSLIDGSTLDSAVKARALEVFRLLAHAEAKIHGASPDDIHFHEVGSLDAIVDVVGACAALEYFAPDRIVASPVPTGRGFAESMHGTIPIPAPAVVELLKDAVLFERGEVELVTPTGAALLAAWCDSFGEMPPLRVEAVGYGAGQRDAEMPNVLRVIVGEQIESLTPSERTELIETNVDDMAPELLPYVVERLMAAGALDAWVTPILMKKGRVAMTLSVLCDPSRSGELLDIVFGETTTLGVRISPTDRVVLDRKEETVQVEGHPVRVKIGMRNGRIVTVAPEYDDAAEAARATGIPLKDVYASARRSLPSESAL